MLKKTLHNFWKLMFGIPHEPNVKLGKIRNSFFKNEYLTDSELNHHVHVVGASGFGKTVLLTKIMKDQIRRGHGCLWLDLKGDREAINEMIEFTEKLGRKADVQIFSISHPDLTGSYNLISQGNATEIRDKIVSSFSWTEEYYRWQAMSYLLKVLTALVYLRDTQGEKFDLSSVYQATTSSDYLESLLKKVPATEVNIKLLLEDCYTFLNRKETQGNLGGLNAQLESLLLTDFGKYLSEAPNGINFFEAVKSGKLVFIFLDSRRYGEAAKSIAKMLVKDLIATSARIDAEISKNQRKLFVSFIDEFADIADESFTAFPDRARSSRMPLLLSHQDLADLKRISEEFYSRMTANMSTLYAFLQSVPESADAIASRAGTKTVWKETSRAERFWFFTIRTGDKSLREVEEFNVHPNVIKSLTVGECVVVKKYPHSRAYVLKVDEK